MELGLEMWDARSITPGSPVGCCGVDLSVNDAPVGFGGVGVSAGRVCGVGIGLGVEMGVEVEVGENRLLLLLLGFRLCGCTILSKVVPTAHLSQTVLLLVPMAAPSEAAGAQTPRGFQVGSGIMVRTFSTSSREAPFSVAFISTYLGILVHFHALWYARYPVGKPLSLSTSCESNL